MALKTLAGMGPPPGYGVARRIEQASAGTLALNHPWTRWPQQAHLYDRGGHAPRFAGIDTDPVDVWLPLESRGHEGLQEDWRRGLSTSA